ncbi:carboxymuconolactone decarboxylase family protein [Siculibacillus lacustris]|uniref:Carboxymuconolactone decarboxylase family protein n=1 Tax=Siculibacillus lacustris TaxID=1549641 RepID=A0A4Q9VTF2_9HYPH|nr:carboxymuconolactone decarboxylase family protein [Siculibacillus lacustris]TBW39220.1 carboxymuconolactone decarboxylase family protein [Siculibacillus lacustris]
MHKDWPKIAEEMSVLLKEVRIGAPETIKGFGQMSAGALKAGALDTRTKELISLAIGVTVRCDPCIAFHAKAARAAGATREEVMETVATAIYMAAGPAFMYAAQAVEAFDQFAPKSE